MNVELGDPVHKCNERRRPECFDAGLRPSLTGLHVMRQRCISDRSRTPVRRRVRMAERLDGETLLDGHTVIVRGH
jgi:hypothetical protein